MFDVPCCPWNDINPAAEWLHTVWTTKAAWVRYHGGLQNLHALFLLPGVSILNVMADILHILDLGLSHMVCGNVLWQLCYQARYLPNDGSPAARCDWEIDCKHYI